jgi:hypothetical protein
LKKLCSSDQRRGEAGERADGNYRLCCKNVRLNLTAAQPKYGSIRLSVLKYECAALWSIDLSLSSFIVARLRKTVCYCNSNEAVEMLRLRGRQIKRDVLEKAETLKQSARLLQPLNFLAYFLQAQVVNTAQVRGLKLLVR